MKPTALLLPLLPLLITAIPITIDIDPRHLISLLSENIDNGAVLGSGNGGNGGNNLAVPLTHSASFSGTNLKFNHETPQFFTPRNTIPSELTTRAPKNDKSGTVVSGNDNSGVVINSGNGGTGGTNVAVPITGSTATGGTGTTGSTAGTVVGQTADGGSGFAVGSYGEKNHIKYC